MAIKARFMQSEVARMIKIKTDRIDHAILSRLQYIGETFVNNARNNNTYLDQTGNLRSSIGYIILKNGKVTFENYKESNRGTDKKRGVSIAKKLTAELKSELGKGYVLIVVAGMDYAAAVESRGKDVLTASSIIAKKQLKDAIENFKNTAF